VLRPSLVRVHAVDAHAQNLGIHFFKFSMVFVEFDDFSRAHKRKIEWVEKQDNPFSFVVLKRNMGKFPIWHKSFCAKIRCRGGHLKRLKNNFVAFVVVHKKELKNKKSSKRVLFLLKTVKRMAYL